MADKKISPYKAPGRFGILNGHGSIWSANTFYTRGEAEQYIVNWQAQNPGIDIRKHKVIPVRVTIEAE